jgi:hypothetical protein
MANPDLSRLEHSQFYADRGERPKPPMKTTEAGAIAPYGLLKIVRMQMWSLTRTGRVPTRYRHMLTSARRLGAAAEIMPPNHRICAARQRSPPLSTVRLRRLYQS